MRRAGLGLVVLALAGCTGTVTDTGTGTSGTLTMTMDDQGAVGTFDAEDGTISFETTAVSETVFEVTLELNGMVLDGLVDLEDPDVGGGVSALDGFAEDGTDTQLLDSDRALLDAFYQSLNDELGNDASDAVIMMRRLVGVWSENPTTVELQRAVLGEDGRTIQYLCSYAYCGTWSGTCQYWNWYSRATHDCCYGGVWGVAGHCTDRYDGDSSQYAQLGNHYYSGCDDGTWTWNGSGWDGCEKDHWTNPYEVGNCFGRSGPGCGGDTQYTKDPTDHDGCVRNGHTSASLWCDDEFTSASDDELFASNCY